VVQAYQAQPRLLTTSPHYLFVDYNILYTACIIIILLYTTIGVLPGIVVCTILLIMLIQPWQAYMEILHLLGIYKLLSVTRQGQLNNVGLICK